MRARIVAQDADDEVLLDAPLAHGEDPRLTLARAGWEPRWLGSELQESADGFVVVLRFRVSPAPRAHPYQRLAAYAVVTARFERQRCLLLTSFANTDRNAGLWGLPGGGIDEGEEPLAAVHREVWEETGQEITVQHPLALDSAHWIGEAPSGRMEDFHALRMIYTAHCSDPTSPVVHDVGGSTDEAAWVPIGRLAAWPPLQTWGRNVINTVIEDIRR
ncbi:MAG: NUDIX domain-containing protein [Ornithinimicrobium sp.]